MQNNGEILLFAVPLVIFLSPFLSRLLRIPTIGVEIILGAVLGLMITSNNPVFELSSNIGFIFLMFLAGLEVEFKKILNIDKSLIRPTILYILIIHIISFIGIFIFNFPLIFIAIFPLISIGIIATLSKEYGGDLQWLKMAFIIGTFAEIISIIEFSLASNIITNGFSVELIEHFAYLILFIVVSVILYKIINVVVWWYPNVINKLSPKIDTQERDIRLSMVILLSVCALSMTLDLEIAFGAFISGMFIRAFFLIQKDLIHKLEGFGFGFLIPIFFIHTGMSFDLYSLKELDTILTASIIVFVMIFARVVASLVFVKLLKLKDIFIFALSHSMPLSILIAFVSIAYHSDKMSEFYYNSFILASLLEVLIATSFIRFLVKSNKTAKN